MRAKVILVVAILMVIFLGYYHERLLELIHQPEALLDAFLAATKLAEFSLVAIGLNVLVLLAAASIEIIGVGWKNSSLYRLLFNRSGTTAADLWCWVLSVLNLYDLFVLIFSFGLFYVLTSILFHGIGEFKLLGYVQSPILQIAIIFVLSDLKHYVWHRFMHQMPFWELHKYHHSATELNLITTTRGHFLEKGFLTIFDAIMFIVLGVPAQYFVLLVYAREFYSFLLHSNLNWSLGWVGKYILVSPLDHRLHHGIATQHFDKNYGTLFIWWDRLFGTYFPATEKVEIGVEGCTYNEIGFWPSMVLETQEFLTAALAGKGKKA